MKNSRKYIRAKEQLQALRAEIRRLKARDRAALFREDEKRKKERERRLAQQRRQRRGLLKRDLTQQLRAGFTLTEMARMLSVRDHVQRTEEDVARLLVDLGLWEALPLEASPREAA